MHIGKSDPYYIISRAKASGWTPVFKSEVLRKTLNPRWKPNSVRLAMLTNGNMERPLKVQKPLEAACGGGAD